MRLVLPADVSRQGITRLVQEHALGIALAAAVSVTAATLAHDRLFHGGANAVGETPADAPAQAAGDARPPGFDATTTVALAEGKFATADIKLGAARVAEVAKEVAVTGRIEADPNRRIEVRPKASGVVRTVPTQPGTAVHAGDVLVVLDSAEVATARLLVRERQRALTTARTEGDWKAEVATNVEGMVARLQAGASAQNLAREFADKRVGTARGTLIAAWTELEMATHEFEKQSDLNKRKIVGEHPVFIAEHTREGAQARFDAALEQVRFDVAQQNRVARQAVRDAEEMVVDAAQHLQILGVAEDISDLLAHPEVAASLPTDLAAMTSYPIVAPIDGTVISTSATRSRRVDGNDPLFVVADLSQVYAVANIPESDFAVLPSLAGGQVRLTATAYPGHSFAARMLYTGAELDPQTRTVRLVAEVANPDRLFLLGMPTRIALDARSVESATVVPAGALVDFDGQATVFKPDAAHPRTFIRQAVKLGRSTPEGQIVTAGIKAGDRIVVAGTFLLKSELILQNDTEDE